MYKQFLLIFTGISLLAGCGGGGGGSSSTPAYTGVTTQATVTTSNAKNLSADAYSGSQLSSAVSGVAKETGDTGGQTALLPETASILEQSVTGIVNTPKVSAKTMAATAQNTVNGYSGSYSYAINVDQNSGAFNGTITFSQYKASSTSITMSGNIGFSGVYNQATGTFSSLTITMSNLAGTSGTRSCKMDGTVTYTTSGASKIIAMSAVLTDNASGRTYWVKDFTLTLTGTSLTVSGTYYDPIHGYVVISTVTPLTVSAIDGNPTSGRLLFTGSNGTKARLTFTNGSYTVEADTAGNGTYVVVP